MQKLKCRIKQISNPEVTDYICERVANDPDLIELYCSMKHEDLLLEIATIMS